MNITIVLNGDIENCCSWLSAEDVEPMVRDWLTGDHTLTVVDREQTTWELDELGQLAERWFGLEAYPLVYLDSELCSFGSLPSRKNLTAYITGEQSFSITKDDIVAAGKAMGYQPAESTAQAESATQTD